MHSQTWARIRVFAVSAAVVALMAAPASAADDRLEDEMRQMRELVLQLQDQVQDQQNVLDDQGDVIRDAGLEERSSGSRLSNFLQTTDFSGDIAVSYFYNLNSPDSGGVGPAGTNGNNTVSGTISPFHPDHNSIQLDEVWLSMSRSASDETPVGFGIDLVFGALGELLGNSGSGGGNGFWLNQAYIDYMPFSGWTLTAGKFGTHIGYEVAGAANNVMITRGMVYNELEAISQIGAKLTWEAPMGFEAMVGVVNGLGENQVDVDGNKDFIWRLGWANDQWTVLFNGEYGGDTEFFGDLGPGISQNRELLLDGVIEFTPTDTLVTWLNVTWVRTDLTGLGFPSEIEGVAVSVGGRLGLGDKAGIGARAEYGVFDAPFVDPSGKTDVWSITGTFDYLLAEGLTAKAELVYTGATVDGFANTGPFPGTTGNDQILLGIQLIYAF